MCTQPWVRMAMWAGVELERFPALAAWVERIEKRPATQAALKVPEQDMLSKIKSDPVRFSSSSCAAFWSGRSLTYRCLCRNTLISLRRSRRSGS